MNNEFDLQRSIDGEPIETTGGNPVEFIAYRPTADIFEQVVVQLGKHIHTYSSSGHHLHNITSIRMKSVVKQIDWAKLPVDTLLILSLDGATVNRYFSSFNSGRVYFFMAGATSKTARRNSDVFAISPSNVQIAPYQPWTIWIGGKCPIPDGLEYDVCLRDSRITTPPAKASEMIWVNTKCSADIIAYRLTGKVLDGYSL
jgi:hypothetical protein